MALERTSSGSCSKYSLLSLSSASCFVSQMSLVETRKQGKEQQEWKGVVSRHCCGVSDKEGRRWRGGDVAGIKCC